MKKSSKFLFFAALLAASCSPKKDKYEAFAEDLCTCMRPMADFQNEISKLVSEGKQDQVMAILERGQKIDEEGQACIAALEKKHGTIEGEEAENKAMEALRKVCPDIVSLMEQSAEPGLAPEEMIEDGEVPAEGEPAPAEAEEEKK